MKKITQKLLLVTTAASVLFLASCGEDDDPVLPAEPTLDVSATSGVDSSTAASLANGGSVPQGDSVYFSLDITALGGIDNIRVGTATIITAEDLNLADGATSTTVDNIFQTTATIQVGQTVSTQFVLIDDSDQRDTVVFEYTIAEPRSPSIEPSTQVLIGGFLNSTTGSFYNAVENLVYTSSVALENDEKVDLLFYYAETPGYTIAALDNTEADATIEAQTGGDLDNFNPQNPTRFKTFLTAPDFDAIETVADLESAYAGDADLSGESRVTELQVGDVFGFVLADSRDSKVGLIKVVATSGTSGSDRAIEIEVLIEPDSE